MNPHQASSLSFAEAMMRAARRRRQLASRRWGRAQRKRMELASLSILRLKRVPRAARPGSRPRAPSVKPRRTRRVSSCASL